MVCGIPPYLGSSSQNVDLLCFRGLFGPLQQAVDPELKMSKASTLPEPLALADLSEHLRTDFPQEGSKGFVAHALLSSALLNSAVHSVHRGV